MENKKPKAKRNVQSQPTSISIAGDTTGNIIVGDKNVIGYTPEKVAELLTQINKTFQPKPFDGRCPYKGLDVFEEEDADLFFGREALVKELVGRVDESRAVFITGPSGSGKSSLVRAGLIHSLKQGAIKNSDKWLYETIKPGRNPFEALAFAFSRLKSPELGKYFTQNIHQPNVLIECAESALSERKDQRLVLFIDQFEEIFTQVSKEITEAFIQLITNALNNPNGRIIILFCMRSDFIPNCATYPELNTLLNKQFIQIGAMQAEELVSAIAQPALRVGLRIDPDLIAQIINDMKGEPGALPLMQFALKDLFDDGQSKGGVIDLTLDAYLRHGGIKSSLERHADMAFGKLEKHEQELARNIFSRLVEIGYGRQVTKRTAFFNELVPFDTISQEVIIVLQKLGDARLVTTDEKESDKYTITHEKLIDAWGWLKKLVNENSEVIALQNEIDNDAKEWEENKRDTSYLYTGARLLNADEQVKKQNLNLNQLAREFVKASQVRKRRSQGLLFSGVSIIVIVSIIASVLFRNQAQANVEIAQTAQAANTEIVAQKEIAEANAEEAQRQAEIALARQIAAQAQSIFFNEGGRKQQISVLLAIQSIKIYSTLNAVIVLQNNTLVQTKSHITHDGTVLSVAFSLDEKYIVSGSTDGIAWVWEAQTGNEVARMTHNGPVYTVAFSPNGKYVVSGSNDGTARVWETQTGNEVARMTHDDWVNTVTFSPDGKYVVSGSDDGTARVWETQTGNEVARTTHDGKVLSVAFSLDGKYVVSGGTDGIAWVWETQTGNEVARTTHDGTVHTVAFSPDGKYVVSGSNDGTARVWETQTGNEIARTTHDGTVLSVAFSLDGKYIVSGSTDRIAWVWEAQTGNEVARMTHDDWVNTVAFSPDGKYVVSGSNDRTARVWETQTGNEVARTTHDDSVFTVAFSPDGKYVVSGGTDRIAWVWETQTENDFAHATQDGTVFTFAFSPDGKYIVSGSNDGTARVWETQTGNEVAHMTHDDSVQYVAFSSDGKYIVSMSIDNTVHVWETQTGNEVAYMTHDGSVNTVAFSPDGKYVVSGSYDGTARVWETQTGNEVARMTHNGPVYTVAFSPDGKYIVSGDEDRTARVWETQTGNEVARMTHDGPVYTVAFSPDGKYIVSGSNDGTVRVWETQTGNEVARTTHDGTVLSVAFSLDGKYVVSGSTDGIAWVWETQTGNEVARTTHDGSVNTVAFSPDGKYVVSGGDDGTARVWEAQTGNEVARTTHEATVYTVAFSLDGKYIFSEGGDGTAHISIWQAEHLIEDACSHVVRNLTWKEWNQYIGDTLSYQAVCENLPIEPEPTTTP